MEIIYYKPKLTYPNKNIRIKLDYPRGETIIRNGRQVIAPDLPMYDPNLLIFGDLDVRSLILLLFRAGVISTEKSCDSIRVANILVYQDDSDKIDG